MPYMIVDKDGQHCLYKHDDNHKPVGESLGCHDSMDKAMAQMRALYATEKAMMKHEDDGDHPAGHYLVVEDPEKSTTWHMRVMGMDGKPDHRLMGAAWAALHEGYRGNRYEGPNKQMAIEKLKKMYAAEDMPMPMKSSIKAVGDWELEVLAVPFGGHNHGKDSDGEYFSDRSNLHLDRFENPLVTYYHGFDEKGHPQGTPESVGEIKKGSWQKRSDGWWVHVVLNKASEYAKRIWEAAKDGLARASSGSVSHLVRRGRDGEILNWPLAELAIFDTKDGKQPANQFAVALPVLKSVYDRAGISLPDFPDDGDLEAQAKGDQQRAGAANAGDLASKNNKELDDMTPEEMQKTINEAVANAMKLRDDAETAAKAAAKTQQDAIDVAVKAAEEKHQAELKKQKEDLEKEFAKSNRLPFGAFDAPAIGKFGGAKYNNLDAGDQALLVGVLSSAGKRISDVALKSLAAKLDEDKSGIGEMGRQAMKMAGIKANEVDYSSYATFGDEWVGIAYSQALWEAIRVATFVANRLPSVEIPQGMESIYLPLESTDPVFYKVAEATAIESTLKIPQATVNNSPVTTGRVQLTLAKMGARVIWTGELEEGSLIPFVGQLRTQLNKAGSEYLESSIIDGDTAAGASANINDIAGTPASTDWFLLYDGLRKSPLVTTTANSRSAAGSLDVTDFIETVKLMGGGGINALDKNAVSFIVDPSTYFKTLTLPEVLTRDVFVSPTLEGGNLKGLWGYGLDVSGSIHKASAVRKANTAGKVDVDTVANNAYGAILAVRWDQWKMGWRRRMTMETTRIANADSTEIVAMMRVGLIQRDTEASAETYYVGV